MYVNLILGLASLLFWFAALIWAMNAVRDS
eukprot:COSAG02_NODE_1650_length_11487_cov_13.602895_6_plen_30_part_00